MEKENKDIEEVLDEINAALADPKGLIAHQMRIGFSISLGVISLLETYLKNLNILKSGSKIDHRWLKKSKENIKGFISKIITCPIEEVKDFDEILSIAYKIESNRNKFVYGKKTSDADLRDYINLFFELNKRIEHV